MFTSQSHVQGSNQTLLASMVPVLPAFIECRDAIDTKTVWTLPPENLEDAHILIVDDVDLNLRVACKYLRQSGLNNLTTTSDPFEVLSMVHQKQPDLVLLDVRMPGITGLELLEQIRSDVVTSHVPIIMLTAHQEEEIRHQALNLGANDFLEKPINPLELLPRVRNLLALRIHQKWLEQSAERLELEVLRRTASLVASERHLVRCLARAAEYRDNDTGQHVIRVGKYAALIAESLDLSDEYIRNIEEAAKLHDIGKIAIPDQILLKSGKLDPDELETMRKHCDLGSQVLSGLSDETWASFRNHVHVGSMILRDLDTPLLRMAMAITKTHHECWDGSGYPSGIKGEHIPLEGRIVAVADVFDALSTRRSYKPAFPIDKCFKIINEGRCKHFDPQVVDAFFSRRSEVLAICLQGNDDQSSD